MRRDLLAVAAVLAAVTLPKGALASQSVTDAQLSNRADNKIGFYLGVVNEPAPSLFSMNVGYNLTDFVRLTAGVGRLSLSTSSYDDSAGWVASEASVTTLGAGAKFMVPGWSLTPTVGIHAATVLHSGKSGVVSVGGFDQNASHLYVSGGLDYQSQNGFNLGIGMNRSLRSGVGSSTYLSVGWFFNWLG